MFMGEYNHTLDAKGRLIIPAKLRESLGEVFFVTKSMDRCLNIYDEKEWEQFEQRINELPDIDKEARKYRRFFLAGADRVEIDKMGRALIPVHLREYAGITKEAVLVGVGNRIEVWSRERYDDSISYEDMDEIAKHLMELGVGL